MTFETDFEQFWKVFPRRVGKLAARKAYEKAQRTGATAEELLDGVALYLRHKPSYADYCYPASWLNAGRWQDEWGAPEQVQADQEDWFDECKRMHAGACGLSRYRHHVEIEKQRGLSVAPVRSAEALLLAAGRKR